MLPVILAAGEGKRFKTEQNISKVMFPLLGKPLIFYVISNVINAGFRKIGVVVGNRKGPLLEYLAQISNKYSVEFIIAEQLEQLGTAHAVKTILPKVPSDEESVIVICGDAPLMGSKIISDMTNRFNERVPSALVLTAFAAKPFGYGRIKRNASGQITGIVEERDATAEEKNINEINSGTYIFEKQGLMRFLEQADNSNSQGEYYLPDIIKYLSNEGKSVESVQCSETEIMGINSRVELAAARKILQKRKLNELMLSGCTIYDPDNTYIEFDVQVGADSEILPGTFLRGSTKIGKNCSIGPNSVLVNTVVGDNSIATMSVLEDAVVNSGVKIGPFSHLRAGAVLEDSVKIGNFVEVKKSTLNKGVKAQHLTYLGDTVIGENTNVGAGTITCNYDGVHKNKTKIGKNVFIGSDTKLVAPVTVGDDVVTAAGSTITKDVPSGALAIARTKQIIKEDWTQRWRKANEKKS